MRSQRPSFEMPTDTITARLYVHLVRNLPKFELWLFTGSATTQVLFTIYSSFRWWKNFENRLGFDKVITISWVVHFLGHSVDVTQRAAVDGYASDCCVLWPFDLISMSHVQVHTWPNFDENIYEDIVFTRFSWAVTLIFDLCSQKLISTSSFSA